MCSRAVCSVFLVATHFTVAVLPAAVVDTNLSFSSHARHRYPVLLLQADGWDLELVTTLERDIVSDCPNVHWDDIAGVFTRLFCVRCVRTCA